MSWLGSFALRPVARAGDFVAGSVVALSVYGLWTLGVAVGFGARLARIAIRVFCRGFQAGLGKEAR